MTARITPQGMPSRPWDPESLAILAGSDRQISADHYRAGMRRGYSFGQLWERVVESAQNRQESDYRLIRARAARARAARFQARADAGGDSWNTPQNLRAMADRWIRYADWAESKVGARNA